MMLRHWRPATLGLQIHASSATLFLWSSNEIGNSDRALQHHTINSFLRHTTTHGTIISPTTTLLIRRSFLTSGTSITLLLLLCVDVTIHQALGHRGSISLGGVCNVLLNELYIVWCGIVKIGNRWWGVVAKHRWRLIKPDGPRVLVLLLLLGYDIHCWEI